jgi:choice-of-anchor A domain-containing protein
MIRLDSRSLFRSILMPAALVASMAQSAWSGPVTLSGFNLITSGDVSTNSDVQGSVLIGGTLKTGLTFGGSLSTPKSETTAVINNIGSGVNFLNTNSTIAGNVSTGVGNFYGTSSSSASLSQFTQSTSTLSSYAAALAGYLPSVSQGYSSLATNSTVATSLGSGNALDFKAAPTTIGGQSVAVFNISTSLFTSSAYQNGNITLTDASGNPLTAAQVANETIVINVTGTSFSVTNGINFGNLIGLNDSANIIFNFESVSSLTNITSLGGSILAPNATLNTGSSLVGGIYVQSITSVGEIDLAQSNGSGTPNGGFTGYVPSVIVSNAAVPEPASLSMIVIGGGIAAGYAAMRRRRAAKA